MASIKVMIVITVEAVVGIRRRGNVPIDYSFVHDKIESLSKTRRFVLKLAINLA